MWVDRVRDVIEVTPLLAEFRRSMRCLEQIATLPLDVVDNAPSVQLRCTLMEINPGWRAMKRARSAITDNASACFSGSDSTTVI
jgi:hypothetical protein